MKTKLRESMPGAVYNSAWTYDAADYCLQTYTIFTGATCVNAAVSNMSLASKSDRRRIRRVANELLRLCDVGDNE